MPNRQAQGGGGAQPASLTTFIVLLQAGEKKSFCPDLPTNSTLPFYKRPGLLAAPYPVLGTVIDYASSCSVSLRDSPFFASL